MTFQGSESKRSTLNDANELRDGLLDKIQSRDFQQKTEMGTRAFLWRQLRLWPSWPFATASRAVYDAYVKCIAVAGAVITADVIMGSRWLSRTRFDGRSHSRRERKPDNRNKPAGWHYVW